MPHEVDLLIQDQQAVITLNRRDKHNALSPDVIASLTKAFQDVGKNPNVRSVVLAAQGKTFCAGADLNWMKQSVTMSKKDNLDSALALYDMYHTVFTCPKPVIGRIHGSAFGGGVGLIACMDVAIMHKDAVMSLSELKLGLIPSTIAPFLLRKVGRAHLAFYGLQSQRISAQTGKNIGLIHEVVEDDASLKDKITLYQEQFSKLAPHAIGHYKKMCEDIMHMSLEDARMHTSAEIASIRTTEEAQEGLQAFFDKRDPAWIKTKS